MACVLSVMTRRAAPKPVLVDGILPARQRLVHSVAPAARHNHVGCAALLPKPVHREQRRMVKLRQQPRFIDEAAHAHVRGVPMAV